MMPGFVNQYLRVHHAELADRARRIYRDRCPCCLNPMVNPRRNNVANVKRRDRQTVAHNVPTGYGGDDTIWVYACNGCNYDQGQLTFRQWSIALKYREDKRAPNVAALADIVEAYLREKAHGRYSRFACTPAVPADA